uniref:Uncharacterized protein n=1 Tax=Octopus bimaculoides TaxID=37653 RepID=A0A0L8GSX9_OCTBM
MVVDSFADAKMTCVLAGSRLTKICFRMRSGRLFSPSNCRIRRNNCDGVLSSIPRQSRVGAIAVTPSRLSFLSVPI